MGGAEGCIASISGFPHADLSQFHFYPGGVTFNYDGMGYDVFVNKIGGKVNIFVIAQTIAIGNFSTNLRWLLFLIKHFLILHSIWIALYTQHSTALLKSITHSFAVFILRLFSIPNYWRINLLDDLKRGIPARKLLSMQ
jgi:hypothetical protein